MIKVIIGAALAVAVAMLHEFGKYAEEINPYNKEQADDESY